MELLLLLVRGVSPPAVGEDTGGIVSTKPAPDHVESPAAALPLIVVAGMIGSPEDEMGCSSGGAVEDNDSVGLKDTVVDTPVGSEGIELDGVDGIEVGVGIKVSNKDTTGISAGF